jgi:hypothetical protein
LWRNKPCLGLHWGMKPIKWMSYPTPWDKLDDEHFLWRHERTSRRRKASPLFPTFDLGGSKHHFLGHDVSLGGYGLMVMGDLMMTWHVFNGGRPLHLEYMAFGGPTSPSTSSTTCHLCQNVTPRGMTSSFRACLFCKVELYFVKGKIRRSASLIFVLP